MSIKSEKEFREKLSQLARLYAAIRAEFAGLTITQANAAKLILSTGKIVDATTVLISDIEEYSGAAEIRRLSAEMKRIREEREAAEIKKRKKEDDRK